PAQQRLLVVDDPAFDPDEARLPLGGARMTANDAVEPDHASERHCPRTGPAQHSDERRERIVALNLGRDAGARTGGAKAAPRNRAGAESGVRRRALKPGDERQLIVGRRERRRGIFEARGGDVVDRATPEQRGGRRADPTREKADGKRVADARATGSPIAP